MIVRKYFCFNIPAYKNMAEELFCRSFNHEEYLQITISGNAMMDYVVQLTTSYQKEDKCRVFCCILIVYNSYNS